MAFKVAECDCVYETEWRGDERWSKRGKDTPTNQKKSLFESSLCLSLAQTTIMHTNISVHFPLITGNNKFLNRVVSTNDTLSCSLSRRQLNVHLLAANHSGCDFAIYTKLMKMIPQKVIAVKLVSFSVVCVFFSSRSFCSIQATRTHRFESAFEWMVQSNLMSSFPNVTNLLLVWPWIWYEAICSIERSPFSSYHR